MKTSLVMAVCSTVILFAGCSDEKSNTANSSTPNGTVYIAKTEPEGALPVGEVRKNSRNGDMVVLTGHIGGSKEPFVDGIAAFTIVDPKIPYCQPDEGCPYPWDYCCTQDQVKNNIATIKFVDDKGTVIAEDARNLLGVKELSLVVVTGKAKRDDHGNLTVMAEKVFLKN